MDIRSTPTLRDSSVKTLFKYVTIDTPQDYLGTDLSMTAAEDHMYMSMRQYIENAASLLNITGKHHDTPIAAPI